MRTPNGEPFNIKTQSIPDIFEEIFAPFVQQFGDSTEYKSFVGQKSSDGSVYTIAFEIPRLVKDTISVEIEEDLTTTSLARRVGYPSYKIVVKAAQLLLVNYLDETQESAKKRYEQDFALHGQNVALDGSLKLSYTEGVLTIEIPLRKPTEAKKQGLSARLSDIES